MTREIKFRAWDGKDLYPRVLPVMNDGFVTFGGITDKVIVSKLKQGVIEQYTGIKDKNSVEIYEGDICRIVYYHDLSLAPTIGVAEYFSDASFSLKAINKDGRYSLQFQSGGHWGNRNAVEVIGNIHENPDLLKP